MKSNQPENWPQFFTATILNWMPLLHNDHYKEIIINSLRFAIKEKRIKLIAFVIMQNHLHLVWQQLLPYTKTQVQLSFMKFTAQQIKFHLEKNNPAMLRKYKVCLKDREYQFWERNPLTTELFTPDVVQQKIDYIHNNPVRAGLCKYPEEYKYSSADYYETGAELF